MRIAFFTDYVAPPQNGVWTSIVNLSSILCEMGHDVIIFTPKPASKKSIKLVDERITIKFLPSIPGFLYPDLRLGFPINPVLITKINSLNIDIVHVHSQLSVGLGGLFLGKMLKIPIIGTQHNYAMEEDYLEIINFKHMTKQISSFLWTYTAFFLNQCHHVIAPIQMIKQVLLDHEIQPPISVLHNTIQDHAVKKISLASVKELKIKLGLSEKVILFVGRLSKEKSVDRLLEHFAKVVKKRNDVSMLIIGNGPQAEPLRKLAKRLKISHKVKFTGEIDQEALLTKGYYQTADLFATASMTEVQPVSLIEAMYFGLPIVGVEKFGVKEMIQHVGILAKPNDPLSLKDQMLAVINSADLQRKLSQKSLREYRHYSPSSIAKDYLSLCNSLINAHKDN